MKKIKFVRFAVLAAIVVSLFVQDGYCMEREDAPNHFAILSLDKNVEIFEWLAKDSQKKHFKNIRLVCHSFHDIVSDFNFFIVPDMSHVRASYEAKDKDLIDLAQLFPNITSLNLAFNKHIMPSTFSCLLNLKALNLHQHGFWIKEYSRSFGEREKLVGYVSDENILELSRLTELNLGDVSEEVTDNGITKLTNLTSLTIGHMNTKITNIGIRQMTQLKKLTLECHGKSINEDGITHLANLNVLDMSFLNINPIRTFVGFVGMTNLTELNLSNRDWIDQNQYWSLRSANKYLKINWKYCNNSNETWN